MLVTTYQHDYVPPYTKRYEFVKKQGKAEKEKEECQCIDTAKIEVPKAAQEKCESGAEWTGIAPMGRLIDPRIIPTKLTPEQVDNLAKETDADCFKAQPNRFLQILRTAYPDLYDRLKQMPKDELNRRLERQRLFTTYQIDYCNMNEYPEGIYESLKEKDDTANLNASKLLQKEGACDVFRANVMKELDNQTRNPTITDPCEHAYKPFKISFTDSARFINSGNNSHWRSKAFVTRTNFSEYMETISRNGCVIIKNNIHDHSKCGSNGKHCRHPLLNVCINHVR